MTVNTGKNLAFLLNAAGLVCERKFAGIRVRSVTADSREIQAGSLFVALSGAVHDGHDYIEEAVRKGCIAVLSEKAPDEDIYDIPIIETVDTRDSLGYIAAAFYEFPSEEAVLIGITGTNGKTTTAWLVESILKKSGFIPGVIGTVNTRFAGEEKKSELTTPGPLELQKLLREMVDRGVSHVVMEVSSHALEQGRVNGLGFEVALFTNLSRDHLDYHPDMDGYFAVKKKLFSHYLKTGGAAVINLEADFQDFGRNDKNDKRNYPATLWGNKLAVFLKDLNNRRVITCGLDKGEVHAVRPEYSLEGINAQIITPAGNFNLKSHLVGEFNLSNLVSASGCAFALGLSLQSIRKGLEVVTNIPGRLERVTDLQGRSDVEPVVFIDYAHTPDALEHVLSTIRPLVKRRLAVVFGCGGDRDKGKRAIMGGVAGGLGDLVILTSDNPRSESPEEIINEIERGLKEQPVSRINIEELRKMELTDSNPVLTDNGRNKDSASRKERRGNKRLKGGAYSVLMDRGAAIKETIAVSQPGDAVVICGKGHESYQIGKFGTIFFDDRLEAIKALKGLNRSD